MDAIGWAVGIILAIAAIVAIIALGAVILIPVLLLGVPIGLVLGGLSAGGPGGGILVLIGIVLGLIFWFGIIKPQFIDEFRRKK